MRLKLVRLMLLVLLAGLFAAGLWLPGAAQAGPGDPGPYGAGRAIVTIERPDGDTFTAQLYYPATGSGDGAPYDGSGAPYAAATFGHGFTVHPDKYRSTMEHLASHGYFVVAPESYLTFWFPSHQGFADDFRFSLDYLEAANLDPGSWLYEQVDTAHFGMAGHSMGGGSSILAAAADPRVKALATLAAAETNPSAIGQMVNVAAPVRLLTGNEDGIVNWQTNTLPMYAAANPPRQLPLIQGGWHCGFLDSNVLFCDSGSLPRAEQLEITRRELVAFFDLYLKGDQGVWRQVWGPERNSDPRLQLQSDPGIGLAPESQSGQGAPGSVVSYTVTVANLDTAPTSLSMLAEDDAWPSGPPPWPTTLIPEQTPVLAPGETAEVVVQIQLPDAPAPEDTIYISARADADGGTRQYGSITTAVEIPTMHVGNIALSYRIVGGSLFGILGRVPILDGANVRLPGAAVTAQWTLPDGQTLIQTAVTGTNGVARFRTFSAQQGLYVLTVLDVAAGGYLYDPQQNLETSEELVVP